MGGTVRAVLIRRPRALLLPLSAALIVAAPSSAQQPSGGGAALGGTPAPVITSPTTPAPTTVFPSTPATTPTPALAVEGQGTASATPTPPPYLTAGSGAQQLPTVATVGNLREPVIPLSPTRIAALVFALICLLLLASAALLRALGLRTAAESPAQATRPPGRLGRLGERTRLLADDVRDFLARSR